jgi:putative DNA modification/repair radical SAM protein
MDTLRKIEVLGESAQHDVCIACGTHASRRVDDIGRWIYPAVLPDGRRISQLKVLQTNACRNNCYYCAQRAGRDGQRTAFSPDELASVFDRLYRRGLVRGLFLSSAIAGHAETSMDRMLGTVELLRQRYRFNGYIHLKILPGVSMAHVEQAVRLASRVSVNLEAPSSDYLQRIAPDKQLEELVRPMTWAHQLIRASGRTLVPAGQTTQFVVGAAGESDWDILSKARYLYRDLDLRRVYFSAFQPVEGTPLEGLPSTLPLREHRLYQSDFLMRQYGFRFEDLVFDDKGHLPLGEDPKQMWANRHPEMFPLEIGRASHDQLLRVPGIGPKSADRILHGRRQCSFRTLRDLEQIGVVVNRAAPYVLLEGKRPAYQLSLW